MWLRPLRSLASLLVALAFLGGATMQAMPVSEPALTAKAGSPMPGCADMAMVHGTDAPAPQKGISPDCVKLMQCLGIADGPVRVSLAEAPVSYAPVAYWSASQRLHGVSVAPSPFPPRSA